MMRGPEPVVGSGPHRSWNRGELQEVHSADRYVRQLVIRVVDEDVRDEAALGLELRPPGTAVPVVLDVLALRLAQDANVGRPGQGVDDSGVGGCAGADGHAAAPGGEGGSVLGSGDV